MTLLKKLLNFKLLLYASIFPFKIKKSVASDKKKGSNYNYIFIHTNNINIKIMFKMVDIKNIMNQSVLEPISLNSFIKNLMNNIIFLG